MIIIEGCDKTGKTTLSRELSRKTGFPIVKFSQPKTKNPYNEYVDFLMKLKRDVILDRFHVGEFVYPVVYNRPMVLTRRHFRTIEYMLMTLGAVTVHASTNVETIKRKFVEDGEEYNVTHTVGLTVDMFDVYFRHMSSSMNVRYNWQNNFDKTFIRGIIGMSKQNGSFERKKRLLNEGYQGDTLDTEFLFVGEIVNDHAIKRNNPRPFDLSASSDVLFNLIREKAAGSHAIINAFKPDGKRARLRFVIDETKPEYVVALGDKASKELDRINVKHLTIPHPGYVKRFMNIRGNQSDFEQAFDEEMERKAHAHPS